MPMTNDIEVSNFLFRQIEDDNFQKAQEVFLSKNIFTEVDADNFFSNYLESTKKENWLGTH
jgi:hypothetical protein